MSRCHSSKLLRNVDVCDGQFVGNTDFHLTVSVWSLSMPYWTTQVEHILILIYVSFYSIIVFDYRYIVSDDEISLLWWTWIAIGNVESLIILNMMTEYRPRLKYGVDRSLLNHELFHCTHTSILCNNVTLTTINI